MFAACYHSIPRLQHDIPESRLAAACLQKLIVFTLPAPQAVFVRRTMANDLLFSGMKKAGKKILRLLMRFC